MERFSLKTDFLQTPRNERGQTVVEYLLMLMVMVTIITSLLSYIKNKYLGDPQKCDQAANKATLVCKINALLTPGEGGKRFQYYRFK